MKLCGRSVSVLMLLALSALMVQADQNWLGQDASQTEWGNFLNWDGGEKGGDLNNHFWIDPFRGATHYNMTFSRDGRSYASDGENNACPLVAVQSFAENQHGSDKKQHWPGRVDRAHDGQREVLESEISADP